MERLGRFGRQADRDRQVAEGLLEVALRAQQVAAADIGRAVVRVGLDGPGEIGERLVVLVGLPEGEARGWCRPARSSGSICSALLKSAIASL